MRVSCFNEISLNFQEKTDPLDAAVFYLAMKKKSLVWGLFRSVRDDKMTAFFANNFAENRYSDDSILCQQFRWNQVQ